MWVTSLWWSPGPSTFLLLNHGTRGSLVVVHGLSSSTRDRTHAPCIARRFSATGPPGKSRSHSLGCLFVLLMVSLAVLQFFFFLLSLIRTHLEGGFFLLPTAAFLHIYRLSSYWTYGLLLFYSPIFILSRTCCIPFSQIHHLYLWGMFFWSPCSHSKQTDTPWNFLILIW